MSQLPLFRPKHAEPEQRPPDLAYIRKSLNRLLRLARASLGRVTGLMHGCFLRTARTCPAPLEPFRLCVARRAVRLERRNFRRGVRGRIAQSGKRSIQARTSPSNLGG